MNHLSIKKSPNSIEHQKGEDFDLSDFERGMVVGA